MIARVLSETPRVYFCGRCDTRHWSLYDLPYAERVEHLRARDGNDCGICRWPIDFGARPKDPRAPSVDHILERRNNGCSRIDNLRLTHVFCNSRRDRYGSFADDPRWDNSIAKPLRVVFARFDCRRGDGRTKLGYATREAATAAIEELRRKNNGHGSDACAWACAEHGWHVMGLSRRLLGRQSLERVFREFEIAVRQGVVREWFYPVRDGE